MPFRAWFERKGFNHPAAYSYLTLAAGAIACMVISVLISVTMYRGAMARDEAQDAAEAERSRLAVCSVVREINRAYKEEAPITQAGKNVARAWAELSGVYRCE